MRVGVHKVLMNSPSDVSGLERLIDAKTIDPKEIVASIGKTEGNGGANDFTRGFATLSFSVALARRLGISPEEVAKRIAFVWSGGTEGVLSPHATLFTRSEAGAAKDKRLAIGIAVTRDFAPEEVGTMAEVREVAAAVRKAQAEAGITAASDVHYVQVKGPLLTPAMVADAEKRGAKLVTRDPNGSKPYARGATALGVALALGEVAEKDLSDAVIAQRMDLYSSVANTSAGGELKNCEILLFGNSPTAGGDLRIGRGRERARQRADAGFRPHRFHLRQGGSAARRHAARPADDHAVRRRHQLRASRARSARRRHHIGHGGCGDLRVRRHGTPMQTGGSADRRHREGLSAGGPPAWVGLIAPYRGEPACGRSD
jgi:cyanuric acid amidohydrolase